MPKWTFAFVVLTACIVAACGRQVTPNPIGFAAGGAAPGSMAVKFDVSAPFNFSMYQYWVIFNTTGNGLTPGTRPIQNNWAAYSAGIEVFGLGGATMAVPGQFLKVPSNPKAPVVWQILQGTTPQQFQYNVNSNGTGTEFTVVFQRSLFLSIASPNPSPTPFNNVWLFNAFTTQSTPSNGTPSIFVDSMGAGGPNDPQWVDNQPTDIRQCSDAFYTALSSGLQIDPPASIQSIEIANNPSPAPNATPCSGDESPSFRALKN